MARPILGVLFFLGINSVEEDTAYIRVVEGSIPSFPIASYGVNSNSIVPD